MDVETSVTYNSLSHASFYPDGQIPWVQTISYCRQKQTFLLWWQPGISGYTNMLPLVNQKMATILGNQH